MPSPTIVREAPASSALAHVPAPQERLASHEPRLEMEEIQGNIFPGFNKDHQTLLFLQIEDNQVAEFRRWLGALVPFIANGAEVLRFNRLFKAMRYRRKTECHTVQATWINVAFSFAGLKKLQAASGLPMTFEDPAFQAGAAAASPSLGDPQGIADEGGPRNWVIGGPEREPDLVLLVASDDQADLDAEVARVENTIYAFTRDDRAVSSGVRVMFKQQGANPGGALSGHEHFGFLDGVSQPGIRGTVFDRDDDFLTASQNPFNPQQGKPGQDLLWPGEFVFGYPRQVTTGTDIAPPGEVAIAGPGMDEWTRNGSLLVFRRLRQDIGAFHRFLHTEANRFDLPPERLGSQLVGRWPSGAPVVRTVEHDDAALGSNDCENNNFEFNPGPPPGAPVDLGGPVCPVNPRPLPRDDKNGLRCPFSGHIRKAYPRNDRTPEGVAASQGTAPPAGAYPPAPPATPADPAEIPDFSEVQTQRHRVLRRGIPWGPPSHSTFSAPMDDHVDRGLLFLCYQTSISEQFEFITKNWINNPQFSDTAALAADEPKPDINGTATLPVGHDPIIGQSPDRQRHFFVRVERDGENAIERLGTTRDWVIPTGAGYFFTPSISALGKLGLPADA